jgi:hypothetical protein
VVAPYYFTIGSVEAFERKLEQVTHSITTPQLDRTMGVDEAWQQGGTWPVLDNDAFSSTVKGRYDDQPQSAAHDWLADLLSLCFC